MKVLYTAQFLERLPLRLLKTALAIFSLAAASSPLWAAPDVTRICFTPPVVPITYTQTVRFEATVTESPVSVAFEYNSVDRPMYDDGTHGDRVAGDGTWTTLFQPNEIVSKLTPNWVYRPFIGYCKPAGSGRYNIFSEIWTPDIGLVGLESLGTNAQRTDYLVNFTATASQLMDFSAANNWLESPYWANRFEIGVERTSPQRRPPARQSATGSRPIPAD